MRRGGAAMGGDYDLHAARQAAAAQNAMAGFLESLPLPTRKLLESEVSLCGDVGLTMDVAESPSASFVPEFALPSWRMEPEETKSKDEGHPGADAIGELFRNALSSVEAPGMVVGFSVWHRWRADVFSEGDAAAFLGISRKRFQELYVQIWRVPSVPGEEQEAIHAFVDEIFAQGGNIRVRLAATACACGWPQARGLTQLKLAAFIGTTRANLSKETLRSRERLGLRAEIFSKSLRAREIFREAQLQKHWRRVGRTRIAPDWLS